MAGITKNDSLRQPFIFVVDTNSGQIRRVAIPSDVQVGLQDNPAALDLFGRLAVSATDYTVTGENQGLINIQNHDTVVAIQLAAGFTPALGRVRVFLPKNPRNGQIHFIKDVTGFADEVPIDISPQEGGTIDGDELKTLTDEYGSVAVVWFKGQWRILVSGVGLTNNGAAPFDASYIVASAEPGLTSERRLMSSSNISTTDFGPGSVFVLDLTNTTVIPGTYSNPAITVDQKGRITSASGGTAPASADAAYVTLASDPSLSSERILTTSVGIRLTDGGNNNPVTLFTDVNVVAQVTGSILRGPYVFLAGLSGSLAVLQDGITPYLVGQGAVSITTQSNGQIIISGSGGSGGSSTGSVDTFPHRQEFAMCAGNPNTAASVASTLGSTRLDPTTLATGSMVTSSLKFQLVYSVTSPRKLTITLRDHTNGVNIFSFVTQSATVPTYLERALALPPTATLYLVNANLDVLGSGGERGTLHMARIEHVYFRT